MHRDLLEPGLFITQFSLTLAWLFVFSYFLHSPIHNALHARARAHTHTGIQVLETFHVSASNDYFSVELLATTKISQLPILPLLDITAPLYIYKPSEIRGTVSLTHGLNSYSTCEHGGMLCCMMKWFSEK